MHDKNGDFGAARLAWEMFTKTGNISYYMLYQELKSEHKSRKKTLTESRERAGYGIQDGRAGVKGDGL